MRERGRGVILLGGFGPFGTLAANPAEAAVRAVDGWRIRGETVVSLVMPVSYRRGPMEVVALARSLRPRFVLGFGVAVRRGRVAVERRALRDTGESLPDVDGALRPAVSGPPWVPATVEVEALCRGLRAEASDDAGRYVCNAWLYDVARSLDLPVGFVHLPRQGIDPSRLARGLEALILHDEGHGG